MKAGAKVYSGVYPGPVFAGECCWCGAQVVFVSVVWGLHMGDRREVTFALEPEPAPQGRYTLHKGSEGRVFARNIPSDDWPAKGVPRFDAHACAKHLRSTS